MMPRCAVVVVLCLPVQQMKDLLLRLDFNGYYQQKSECRQHIFIGSCCLHWSIATCVTVLLIRSPCCCISRVCVCQRMKRSLARDVCNDARELRVDFFFPLKPLSSGSFSLVVLSFFYRCGMQSPSLAHSRHSAMLQLCSKVSPNSEQVRT